MCATTRARDFREHGNVPIPGHSHGNLHLLHYITACWTSHSLTVAHRARSGLGCCPSFRDCLSAFWRPYQTRTRRTWRLTWCLTLHLILETSLLLDGLHL